jgi:SAM-dependent methyltransferase
MTQISNTFSDSEDVYLDISRRDIRSIAETLSQDRAVGPLSRAFGNLPSDQTQSNYTGLSKQQTFIQALTYLDLCKRVASLQRMPFERHNAKLVLDFGCGWGRITQLLALYFRPEHIFGCDVQAQAISEVRRNGVQGVFHQVEPWPPSGFNDHSVDFIFSYSVFSHLSEDNSYSWIREFHRILRPGGIAFLTTRHRNFFDHLELVHKSSDIPAFAGGAFNAFRDLQSARRDYDEGRFCFDGLGGGGKELTNVYGEAFIPPHYVYEKYGKIFSAVGLENPVPEGLLDQATIWLQK